MTSDIVSMFIAIFGGGVATVGGFLITKFNKAVTGFVIVALSIVGTFWVLITYFPKDVHNVLFMILTPAVTFVLSMLFWPRDEKHSSVPRDLGTD